NVTRDEVLRRLHHLRIGCGVHYRAVHLLDYYRRTFPGGGPFPNAEYISERTFSIPLSPAVTDEDAADVVRALHTVLGSDGRGVDLSLVIPCFNEASHLRGSVAALVEVLDATRYEYEVVFVDDGSQDGTRELLHELCATTPRCRSILHERNRGRGAAFKTGWAATSGRVTGFLDIDLEVGAHYIPPLVALIDRHGIDVATGYRHYLLRQTLAWHRVLLSWIYRGILDRVVGWGIRDSETGCKFFRRETAAGV